MKNIIVIVGPTGVGKTKLGISLAKRLDAEIINGDSVAVYRGLDIGSAKPTMEEREGIVHHLLDICEVTDSYSVFDYQRDVRSLIEQISNRDKRIIIVGGTGLYIKAALYDYEFSDGTKDFAYDHLTNEEIYQKIVKYDSEVSVHLNNRKRLIRLLNKYENQEPISKRKDHLLYPCEVIGLTTDRTYLYERINQRVLTMLDQGLVQEVLKFKDFYSQSRILNSGIGYKEFAPYLLGMSSLEEVVQQIQLDSRRYAKRQYTFFRHQFDPMWFEVHFSDFNQTIEEVYQFIEH